MGLLSNSVAAHPYQNQTWVPPRDLDMEIDEEVVTCYFPKNIINHKFVQYILQVSSGNLKPMLKVDVPILPCVFTISTDWPWLLKCILWGFSAFHPDVTSCLLSRGKTKYATLGMRLWCKYIRNYLLVYQLTSHFLPYLQNYKEFEGEISDLQ